MKYQVYESIITTKDTTSTNRHMICDIKATLYNIFFLMNFWDFFLEGGGVDKLSNDCSDLFCKTKYNFLYLYLTDSRIFQF